MPEKQSTITAQEIITIGSDPEFAIVSPTDKTKTFDACEVFQPKGDAQSMGCEFGHDGHSATGEIRPKPHATPKEAVAEIKALLERNKKLYPQVYKFNLMATSKRLSLGGHIHFGSPLLTPENPDYDKLIKQMVENLDNLLAFPCLYLENKEDSIIRRENYSYGHLSDFRTQNWGFEYRTLSSFIASRELTSDVFFLGHAIADATINHNFKCKPITNQEGFGVAYNHQARELLKPHLQSVFRQERALPKVKEDKEYGKAIEDFIGMVKKEMPLFDTEIKQGWNIKFNINDFWKVEKIETLIEKIAKLLITIHTTKRQFKTKTEPIRFVKGSYKDLSCPEIAKNVNIALNHLLSEEILSSQHWQTINIYGLGAKKGNKIWLGQLPLTTKRKKQVLGMFWDIANNFQHTTKITEIAFTGLVNHGAIAFGRKLREENLLLPEAMTIIAVLLLNKDLYKQTITKGKKEKKLYLTKSKVVKPFIKHIKKADKFVVKPPKVTSRKLPHIELPFIFSLDKNNAQIYSDLQSLSSNDKAEIARVMLGKAKKFRELLKKDCKKTEGEDCSIVPIGTLCGRCIASVIKNLCTRCLSYASPQAWTLAFLGGGKRCVNCAVILPKEALCENCGKCFDECCSCENCCVCNYQMAEDESYYCENCEEDFCSDHYCLTCSRCNNCCNCVHEAVAGETIDNPTQEPDPLPLVIPNLPASSQENVIPFVERYEARRNTR